MKKIIIVFLSFILIFSAMNFVSSKPISPDNTIEESENPIDTSILNKPQEQQILQNINRLDGFFTENRGQVGNDSVRYYIQGKGVWFLDDGVVFEIQEPVKEAEVQRDLFDRFHPEFEPEMPVQRKSVVLKLNFEGCKKVTPTGRGLLTHRSNFFYGNDSSKWCTNVPNYQEIIYENIYENIDLRYYTTVKDLKYDFIVHPGGDPNDVRMSFEGTQDLYVDSNNNLRVQTDYGGIVDSELLIYQNSNNLRNKIDGKFIILDSRTYGFKILSEYDSERELVIDPLMYFTYVSGSKNEVGYVIAIDSTCNAYVTGGTLSANFPTTAGANDTIYNGGKDVFVLKLNATGSTLMYSTYVGGSDDDYGYGIALDSSGNAYVSGYTESSDFPTTAGANDTTRNGVSDGFVLKLNSTGSTLLYSTFLGGSSGDYGYGIAIDSTDNVYVTGYTLSADFPTTPGANDTTFNGGDDGFVLKLNATGSTLMYSTYVGGSDDDYGRGITIDSTCNAYVTGETNSSNFPTTAGANDTTFNGGDDVFVLMLNPTGSMLMYSTFVGGSSNDYGHGIASDSTGNAYVTGYTWSFNFPTTPGAYDTTHHGFWDVFVLKLNATGSSLLYSTYVGGTHWDKGYGIASDSTGNAYVTGYTMSSNFPTTPGAYDTTHNGGLRDIFVVKLNPVGSSLVYSTFIGGSSWEEGYGIAVDSTSNAYVTGYKYQASLPDNDVFVFKLIVNNLPSVVDLKISEPTVLRTNLIYLYSNATDFEDLEQELIPHFEYRDPNEQVWNSTYFSNSIYNNSRWEVSFTPLKNATLGIYDFRVRFNDTGQLFGNWFYLTDALRVLNNIPLIENLSLSNNSALLGDTIIIWINGSDVEESEKNLTIELEYRDPNEQSWNITYLSSPIYITSRWEYTFNIPFDASFGYYDFRARFNDSDGDYSQWLYSNDLLFIYNIHPKIIDIALFKNSVYRPDSVYLYINGTDYETPEFFLTPFVQYKHDSEIDWSSLTGEYSNSNKNWQTEFVTTTGSTLGLYDFRVRFEDNETASSNWMYLNDSLEVLNNIPLLIDFITSEITVYRTSSIIIYANGTDIENSENLLTCEIQYKPPSGDWMDLEGETFNSDQWEVIFTPTKEAELGAYDLRINFTDLDGDSSDWTIIEDAIEVKNNLPIISEFCDDFEVGVNLEEINLTQFGSDIEDLDENLIWSIDQTTVDTTLFSASIIDISWDLLYIIPEDNVTGSDDITLILTDKDDGTAIKTDVTIHVDSRITEFTPKVTLLSPADESLVNTLTPTLKWELDYSGTELITYTVILDENPEPLMEVISELTTTSYTLEYELEDDKTYYWKVIPKGGICLSEPFSFTVNLGFEPIYNVNLTAEKNYIVIKQGEFSEIELTVKNEGNTDDTFKIEYSSDKLQTLIDIDKTNIQLTPEITSNLKLSVTIPEDFELGDYYVKVTATSLSDERVSDEININVDVVSKDFVPDYNVSISVLKDTVEIKQGESENITLTITNEGNIGDDYTISFESDDFGTTDIKITKSSISLGEGDNEQIIITVTIPENMAPGDYTIKFTVEGAGTSDETTLTIKVKEKGDGVKPGDGEEDEDNTMLYASFGIIVIIIIVVLILLFLFVFKKKLPKEPEPVEEERLPEEQPPQVQPAQPPQEVPSTEVPPPQVPQVVKQPVEQPPQLQIEQSEQPPQVTPVPTVEPQVEQSLQPMPTPQVEQPPQQPVPVPQHAPQEPVVEQPEQHVQESPKPEVTTQVPQVVQPPHTQSIPQIEDSED